MLLGGASYLSGLSPKLIEEEDIIQMQLATLIPTNKYYLVYTIISYVIVIISKVCMTVACYLEGDMLETFESSHVLLIGINMFITVCAFNFNSDNLYNLLKAIDHNFYSYGDTMDEASLTVINKILEEKQAKKKFLTKLFKSVALAPVVFGIVLKRPILYLINGHGKREVDGVNGIIYESPTGIYIPYAEYWIPYIIGQIISYNFVYFCTFAAFCSPPSFMRNSEEFCSQLEIIKLGLQNIVRRAEHLYTKRNRQPFITPETVDSEFNKCLQICLNRSIEHHVLVTKLFSNFRDLSSLVLFTVIIDGGIVICISSVLYLSSETTMLRLGIACFVAIEVIYTYIYCSYGQRIATHFEDIGNELYQAELLHNPNILKPYMSLSKSFSFIPRKLTAGGFATADHATWLTVLQTSYSFINFLLTMRYS